LLSIVTNLLLFLRVGTIFFGMISGEGKAPTVLPLPWGIKPGPRRAGCPPKYFQDKKGNAEDNGKDKLEDSAGNGIREDLRDDSKKLKTIQTIQKGGMRWYKIV